MSGNGLASFASGLTQSLFGGLLQDRQAEQERKDKALAMQLAAFHSLMNDTHTPVDALPDIQMEMAKLLGAEKEFAPFAEHFRQQIKQHAPVPYGPEKETAQSIADRMAANSSRIPEATVELPNTIQTRPTNSGAVPLGGGQPRTAPVTAVPLGGNQYRTPSDAVPLGGGTFTFTRPAVLPRVPEEPAMYQPTVEYGSLSQGEAVDLRKGKLYADQQEEMLRRQLAIQAKVAEAQAAREAVRAESQRQQEELRQKGRLEAIKTTYDQKAKLLAPSAAAKIDAERIAYKNSLMYGPNPMSEADATAASYNLFHAQMDTKLAEQKQKIEESKARMTRMGILNSKTFEDIRKAKGGLAGASGISTAQKREFDLRTGTIQNEFAHTLQLLDEAYKKAAGVDKSALNGTLWARSPEKAEVDRLEAKKAELWGQIDEVRNSLLNQSTPSVPNAPGAAPRRVRKGGDPLGLYQ